MLYSLLYKNSDVFEGIRGYTVYALLLFYLINKFLKVNTI